LGHEAEKEKRNGQTNIFSLINSNNNENTAVHENISLPEIDEFNDQELLTMEKEILGFYLSKHPLDDYREKIKKITDSSTSLLADAEDKSHITIGGIISGIRKKTTKNGNMMAYFILEDFEGTVDIIVFPKTFDDHKDIIIEENIIIVEGKLDIGEFSAKILAEAIFPVEDYKKKKKTPISKRYTLNADDIDKKYCLHIETEMDNIDMQKLHKLKNIFTKYPGYNPIILHYKTSNKTFCQRISNDFRIKYDQNIVAEIKDFLVNGKVWFDNTA